MLRKKSSLPKRLNESSQTVPLQKNRPPARTDEGGIRLRISSLVGRTAERERYRVIGSRKFERSLRFQNAVRENEELSGDRDQHDLGGLSGFYEAVRKFPENRIVALS